MRSDDWYLTDDIDEFRARAWEFLCSRPALHTTALTTFEKLRTVETAATTAPPPPPPPPHTHPQTPPSSADWSDPARSAPSSTASPRRTC